MGGRERDGVLLFIVGKALSPFEWGVLMCAVLGGRWLGKVTCDCVQTSAMTPWKTQSDGKPSQAEKRRSAGATMRQLRHCGSSQ